MTSSTTSSATSGVLGSGSVDDAVLDLAMEPA
jgi:hypothetical protein